MRRFATKALMLAAALALSSCAQSPETAQETEPQIQETQEVFQQSTYEEDDPTRLIYAPGSLLHDERDTDDISYIVVHDTEMPDSAAGVVSYWKNNGDGIASHYIIDRDGSVTNVVPIEYTAWHAGKGAEGSAESFGISAFNTDDSPEYDKGMNEASVGIELCHMAGEEYTQEQINALWTTIEEINNQLGKKAKVIGHKEWDVSKQDPEDVIMASIEEYRTNNESVN